MSLTSEVGTVVPVTWDASLLGTADGSAVELRIVGTASVDRSVEVGAVEWDARVPATGAELLGSRALLGRWPAEGRGVGRDPVEFAQRYAYAGNNPVAFTDPAGLCFGICIAIALAGAGLAYITTETCQVTSCGGAGVELWSEFEEGSRAWWEWGGWGGTVYASDPEVELPSGLHGTPGRPGYLPRLNDPIPDSIPNGATEEEVRKLLDELDESIPNREENLEWWEKNRSNRPGFRGRQEQHQRRIDLERRLRGQAREWLGYRPY